MKTFTSGMAPIEEIEASLPFKYEMLNNKRDMLTIIRALNFTACNSTDEELEEAAYALRADILTTIGIEEI